MFKLEKLMLDLIWFVDSLSVTIISYMEKLRVSVVAEDGFIDSQKLKSCVEHVLEVMLNGTVETKFLNSH